MLYRCIVLAGLLAVLCGCGKALVSNNELTLDSTLSSISGAVTHLQEQLDSQENQSRHGMYLAEASIQLALTKEQKDSKNVSVDFSAEPSVSIISGTRTISGGIENSLSQSRVNTITLKFKSVYDWTPEQLSAWNQLCVVDPNVFGHILNGPAWTNITATCPAAKRGAALVEKASTGVVKTEAAATQRAAGAAAGAGK